MTPVARLKFDYEQKHVLDPSRVIVVLEEMELTMAMLTAKIEGLEQAAKYTKPEAH